MSLIPLNILARCAGKFNLLTNEYTTQIFLAGCSGP